MGPIYSYGMRIIAWKTLRDFCVWHRDAEQYLRVWYRDVKLAQWKSPNDIRRTYANASIVGNKRVVFNIRGNNYRLIAAVNFDHGIVYIRFIGTHKEYDKIDAATI